MEPVFTQDLLESALRRARTRTHAHQPSARYCSRPILRRSFSLWLPVPLGQLASLPEQFRLFSAPIEQEASCIPGRNVGLNLARLLRRKRTQRHPPRAPNWAQIGAAWTVHLGASASRFAHLCRYDTINLCPQHPASPSANSLGELDPQRAGMAPARQSSWLLVCMFVCRQRTDVYLLSRRAFITRWRISIRGSRFECGTNFSPAHLAS